jgi:anti-sigma B factor antagonist
MRTQAGSTDSSQSTHTAFAIGRQDLDARTSVIAVAGELDLATAPELKWTLLDALEEGHSQLILDLSGTSFMDSTALGVLVGVNRSFEQGGTLAIVCAHAGVLKIFELSGVDGVFAILPTLEDALAAVRARAGHGAHVAEAG